MGHLKIKKPIVLLACMKQVELNNRVLLEAKTLIKHGYIVNLIGFTYDANYTGKSHINNIPSSAYQLYNGRKGFKKIIRYLSAVFVVIQIWIEILLTKADVYHAHNFHVLIPSYIAALFRGKKLIYDSHEIWTHHEDKTLSSEHIFAYMSEKLCAHRIDALIGTNELMEKFIQKKYNIRKSLSLYNTVRVKKLRNQKLFHHRYNWPEDAKVALFQGGLWPTGRPLIEIIEAARFLPEDIKVVLLGCGPEDFLTKLQAHINSNNLQEKVKIHPPVYGEELLDYTASADLGLNLIKGKNIQRQYQCTCKLFEYCMAGIPVVSSSYPFNKWVHDKYDIGLVINSENIKEISDSIVLILSGPEKKYQYFCQNSALASVEFNWENQETKLVDLYNELCA